MGKPKLHQRSMLSRQRRVKMTMKTVLLILTLQKEPMTPAAIATMRTITAMAGEGIRRADLELTSETITLTSTAEEV
jgi:hypothetical protein